jgi:hypothetical protein
MTMATNMSHVVEFADAFPIAAIVSTLSAKTSRHMVQLVLPLTQFVATLSRQLSWSHFVNLLPLKRLDRHERQPGEEAPIGLILRAESSREQVELLQMHKDGITVAEYWTELPPKAELEQKLHAALTEARERLARRGVLLGDLDDE